MVEPRGARACFVVVEGLTKTFDRLVALDSVDLELAPGEVHALLGENGAGKTTLSNILAGLYRPDAGRITVDGDPVQLRSPADAIRHRIGMVHQHFQLVPVMSVAENLHMGWSRTPRFFSTRQLNEHAAAILDEVGLRVDPAARIYQLSVGEQQRVEIARTLARGARLLILDEPTAVLTDREADDLFAALRRLAESGKTVIFISHKLKEVLSVADRITVLRGGRRVQTMPVEAATVDALARLMTGSNAPIPTVQRSSGRDVGEPVLNLRGVEAVSDRGLPALRGIDLTVCAGEIVGVAGVSGNGQTELAQLVVGLRQPTAGTVDVAGGISHASPPHPGNPSVGHIPEDRLGSALVGVASTRRNAVLRRYRSSALSRGLWLRWKDIRDYAKDVVSVGRVQVREMDAPVSQLSGGNQQRLVATREALVADNFLLAVHPTRGLDVQAAAEVRQTLEDRRRAGAGVLLISDDLDEVLSMSDRIVVLYDGTILGSSERHSFDREHIGLLMGGHREEAAST